MTTIGYSRRQRSFDCRIGDTVTIFTKSLDNEWDIWTEEMDASVGKSGTVLDITTSGILVKVPEVPGPDYQQGGWYFPYTCLKLLR